MTALARTAVRGLGSVASVLVLLLAWEALARTGWISAFLLPSLASVLARVGSDVVAAEFWANLGTTLYRAGAAFGIAATIAAASKALDRNRLDKRTIDNALCRSPIRW